MKVLARLYFVLCCMFAFSLSSHADKTVYLTSLDWPPYSGNTLKEQGASVAVAKAAFKAMGYNLVVEFLPWSRAVNLAKQPGSKYMGYFPEYYSDDVAKEFAYSDAMGTGPLGFAQNAKKPVNWNSLDDLSNFSIGVVRDYVNTTEFDSRVASGKIKVIPVSADVNNMQKVAAGRIDMAVVDKNVMNYLFANDPKLASMKGKASFNSKLLEDKKLYVCFKNSGQGTKLRDIYNQGLQKIDVKAIMDKHLAQ